MSTWALTCRTHVVSFARYSSFVLHIWRCLLTIWQGLRIFLFFTVGKSYFFPWPYPHVQVDPCAAISVATFSMARGCVHVPHCWATSSLLYARFATFPLLRLTCKCVSCDMYPLPLRAKVRFLAFAVHFRLFTFLCSSHACHILRIRLSSWVCLLICRAHSLYSVRMCPVCCVCVCFFVRMRYFLGFWSTNA